MKNFYIYPDRVDIVKNDGTIFPIYFTPDSGKVYYRYKIDTISSVKHSGIYLGIDWFGNRYFLHNHIQNRKAAIVTEAEFTKGNPLYLYNEKCTNAPLKVIEIGLRHVLKGERYHFLNYNCQTLTNSACHNQRRSEDAEKWIGRGLLGLFAAVLLGAVISK